MFWRNYLSLCTILFYFHFIIIFFPCLRSSATKNYGKYEIVITEASVCKGPKRKECADTSILISGKSTIAANITVLENIKSVKVKLSNFVDNKEAMSVRVNKPCDHIFFMPLLKAAVNITDDCVILRGSYIFIYSFADAMRSYKGEAFLFGNWTYKSVFYSDVCNFSCGVFTFAVLPIKKNN